MRHRPSAPKVIEEAALALAEFGRRNLVGEVHVAGAAGLGKRGEEGLRPLEFIERQIARAAGCHRHDDLRDPVGMGGTARHIDHWKAGFGLIILAKETALTTLQELESLAFGGVWRCGWNAPHVAQSPMATTEFATLDRS